MMKIKILFFQLILFLAFGSLAQSSKMDFLSFTDEDDLKFNDSVIKKEQIKSAMVIEFIGKIDVDGLPEKYDTCYVLTFDKDGKPLKITNKNGTLLDYVKKPIVVNEKISRYKDSLVRIFEDSTHFYKLVYDTAGQILEKQFWPKQSYLSIVSCSVGDKGRNTYKYDSQGRLIYIGDYRSRKYDLISYTCYGIRTQTFSFSGNELLREEVKLIYESNNQIKIVDDSQIITIYKDKQNQLPVELSIIDSYNNRKLFWINYSKE
jgi:hypothetical protein